MFHGKRLKELEEMQELLVVQADMHRALMQIEAANVTERLGWIGTAGHRLRLGSPLWIAGAVAGGLVAWRRWRAALPWISAGLTAWRWSRRFLGR